MGWANRITLLRAVLTFALWTILALAAPDPTRATWYWAFGLFALTAATDAVDGIVARHFGEVSVFGRIADPLVDKLLVLGTMIVLLGVDGVPAVLPAWAVALILARELLVTALRGAVEGLGTSFQALPLGKAKMLLQVFAVGGVLLYEAGFSLARWAVPVLDRLPGGPTTWSLAHALVWGATILTVVSGVDYAFRAARLLADA